MAGPSLRLQAACPCCGQALRNGWRPEQRWGRFIEFGGPGKIRPLSDVPLNAPSAMVRSAASVAAWMMSPEEIVANVYSAADALARAGWPWVVQAPQAPPMPPAPSSLWPTTGPR